jgi:hypothetical protein
MICLPAADAALWMLCPHPISGLPKIGIDQWVSRLKPTYQHDKRKI